MRNVARLVVRPAEGGAFPGVGHLLRAKYDTGPEFAQILIVDARRAFLADLSDEDARHAGYRSSIELRAAGESRWRWKSADLVTLLTIRPLGTAR